MRATTLFLASLSLFVLSALAGSAAQDATSQEPTALARQMERIEEALGGLRRSVRDPEKREESLAAVLVCQEALVACKREVPAMTGRVPEGERESFLRDYRLELIRLERALLDLEEGLLQGKDVETLRDLYKAIKGLEDPAHERFTEDG